MPNNLEKLHATLVNDGYEVPDTTSFEKDMSDPSKVEKLHATLVNDGYEVPDLPTFLKDISPNIQLPNQPPVVSSMTQSMNAMGSPLGAIGRNMQAPKIGEELPIDTSIPAVPKLEYTPGEFRYPNDTPEMVIRRDALEGIKSPLVGKEQKSVFTDDDLPLPVNLPKTGTVTADPTMVQQIDAWISEGLGKTVTGMVAEKGIQYVASALKPAAGVFVEAGKILDNTKRDLRDITMEPIIRYGLELNIERAKRSGDTEQVKLLEQYVDDIPKYIEYATNLGDPLFASNKALQEVDVVVAGVPDLPDDPISSVIKSLSYVGGELALTALTMGGSSIRIPTYAKIFQGTKNPLKHTASYLTNLEFGKFPLVHATLETGKAAEEGADFSEAAKTYLGATVDAWWWESLGQPGHMVSSKIAAKQLERAGGKLSTEAKGWNKVAGVTAGVTGTATSTAVFGAEAAIKDLITEGEVRKENLYNAMGMAIAFGAKDMKSMAALDISAARVSANKRFLEGSEQFMDKANAIKTDPTSVAVMEIRDSRMAELTGGSQEASMGRKRTASELIMVADQLNNALRNPEAVKAIAREQKIGEKEVVSRINSLLDTYDPVSAEARKGLQEIEDLKTQQVELEGAGTETSKLRADAIKGEIASKEKQVANLFREPYYYYGGKRYSSKEDLLKAIDENPPSAVGDLVVRNDNATLRAAEDRVNAHTSQSYSFLSGEFAGKVSPEDVVLSPSSVVAISRSREGLPLSQQARDKAVGDVSAELRFVDAAIDKGVGKFFGGNVDSALAYRTKLQEFYESLSTTEKDVPRKEKYEKEAQEVLDIPLEQLRATDSRELALDFMEAYDPAESNFIASDFLNMPQKEFNAASANIRDYRMGVAELTPASESILRAVEQRYQRGDSKDPNEMPIMYLTEEAVMAKIKRIKNELDAVPDAVAEKVLGKTEREISAMDDKELTLLYHETTKRVEEAKAPNGEVPAPKGVQEEKVAGPTGTGKPVEVVKESFATEQVAAAPLGAKRQIKMVAERERSYRQNLIESYRTADKSLSATIVPGLTQERIELMGKLAGSYVRQGVKSSEILFKELSREMKEYFATDIKMSDVESLLETKLEGTSYTLKEVMATEGMDIQKSIDIAAKAGKSDKLIAMQWADFKGKSRVEKAAFKAGKAEQERIESFKAAEQNLLRDIKNAKSEAEKVALGEKLKEQKLKERWEVAFARKEGDANKERLQEVKQAKIDIAGFIDEHKSTIDNAAPELSAALLKKLNRVETVEQADSFKTYLTKVLNKKTFANQVASIEENIAKVTKSLKSGKKFGSLSPIVRQLVDAPYDLLPAETVSRYNLAMKELATSAVPDVSRERLTNLYEEIRPVVEKLLDVSANKRWKQVEESVSDIADAKVAERLIADMMEPELTLAIKEINPDKVVGNATDKTADRVFDAKEADLLREFKQLLSPEMVKKFSPKELNMLSRVVEAVNKNNWISPKVYKDFVLKAKVGEAAAKMGGELGIAREVWTPTDRKLAEALRETAPEVTKGFKEKSVEEWAKSFRPVQKYLIDGIHGIDGTSVVYDSSYKKIANADSKVRVTFDPYAKKISELRSKHLGETTGFDKVVGTTALGGRSLFDSEAILEMYLRTREDRANPDLPTHLPDYIKNLDEGSYSPKEKERLRALYEFLPRDAQGNIDLAKMEAEVLTPGEKALVKEMDRASTEDILPILRFSETMYRGGAFKGINSYARIVADGIKTTPDKEFADLVDMLQSGKSHVSFAAGSAKERVGTPTIRFSPTKNFLGAYRDALTDYHMTPAIQEVFGTFGRVKDGLKNSKDASFINSLTSYVKNNIQGEYVAQRTKETIADEMVKEILSNTYRFTLASAPRILKELPSNVAGAMFYPAEFHEGISMLKEYGKMYEGEGILRSIMQFTGGTHQIRFGSSNLDRENAFTKRMISPEGTLKSTLAGKASEKVGEAVGGVVGKGKDLADSLIRLSDSVITRPVWVGSFSREFSKQTGEKFDGDKFMNDPNYRFKFQKEIQAASDKADGNINVLFNASSTYDVADILRSRSTNYMTTMGKAFWSFMRSYPFNDAANFSNAAKSLYGKGTLESAGDGARQMSMIVARNHVYNILGTYIYNLYQSALGEEDDSKYIDMTTSDYHARQALATAISIPLGRWAGPVKSLIGLGIELGNKEITENVQGKPYDPYKDKLVMSAPTRLFDSPTAIKSYTPLFGGISVPAEVFADVFTYGPSLYNGDVSESDASHLINAGYNVFGMATGAPFIQDMKKLTKAAAKGTGKVLSEDELNSLGLPSDEEMKEKMDEIEERMREAEKRAEEKMKEAEKRMQDMENKK